MSVSYEVTMDILQKCQKWHKEKKFDKIIKELDAIDPSERTPQMDCELARALNNLGVRTKNGSYMLNIAISLLKKHEELMGESYIWNYSMGYAHYFLDKKGPARKYFMKAIEIEHAGKDCYVFIYNCIMSLTLPRYEPNFRTRVLMAWLTFADQEKEIRSLLAKKNRQLKRQKARDMAIKIFRDVIHNFGFSIGFNGSRYELTFSPLGNSITFLELSYLKQHAPKAVLKHWDIVIGRAATNDNYHMVGDVAISNDELQLWLSTGQGKLKLSAYCPKLNGVMAHSLKAASKIVEAIIYTAIGEIAYMYYVRELELLDEPKSDKHLLLCDLQNILISVCGDLNIDDQQYLEANLYRYTSNVVEEPSKIWRDDIVAGTTFVPDLMDGYFNDDESAIDKLHDDGVVAGFIAFSLDSFDEDERADQICAFREAFEEYLTQDGLDDVVKVFGSATGVEFGYVDVLVWDHFPFLDAAKAFFKDSKIEHAVFHTFRMNVGSVILKKPARNQGQLRHKSDYDVIWFAKDDYVTDSIDMTEPSQELVYDPQHPQAFYAQIEDLNDDNEYLKSIAALESVDRKYWNVNHVYLLVNALQGYATVGDKLNQAPKYKGDQALLRSIKLLKEFQAKGKKEARWHMRMAYGYQYLYGQEEQAIAYAKTWAELAPEDEDAKRVINECQEEIEKRSAPLIELMDEVYNLDDSDDSDDTDDYEDSEDTECGDDTDDSDESEGTECGDDTDDSDESEDTECGDDSEDGEASSFNRKGQFICSIMLDKLGFDKDALIESLKNQWGIVDVLEGSVPAFTEDDAEDSAESEALYIRQGKMLAFISYKPCKLPQKNLEYAAQNNFMWPDAHKALKQHKAHFEVVVVDKESDLIDRAMLFAKIAAACCALKSASAVYFNYVIIQKEFYADMANIMKYDILPISNWIWIGLYKSKNGMCAYTCGLDLFGKEEIEVLDAACEPKQLHQFVYYLAHHVIANEITLEDGGTIGPNATDMHTITRSKGVANPTQQTLKVKYFKPPRASKKTR